MRDHQDFYIGEYLELQEAEVSEDTERQQAADKATCLNTEDGKATGDQIMWINLS